jgi:protein SCO1/2
MKNFCIIVTFLWACCMPPSVNAGGTNQAPSACCVWDPGTTGIVSDTSLYQLESKWTSDKGAVIKLQELAGKPQLVLMFFASCNFTCPMLVNHLKQIESALPENLRTNVGFTLISFDAERDTPAALAKYREGRQLSANWTLLRGRSDDVLEIAALLGVKFKRDERGDFSHSNLITLLNRKGEITFQEIGLTTDKAPLVSAVGKLLQTEP